jgi:hypothetical protein
MLEIEKYQRNSQKNSFAFQRTLKILWRWKKMENSEIIYSEFKIFKINLIVIMLVRPTAEHVKFLIMNVLECLLIRFTKLFYWVISRENLNIRDLFYILNQCFIQFWAFLIQLTSFISVLEHFRMSCLTDFNFVSIPIWIFPDFRSWMSL